MRVFFAGLVLLASTNVVLGQDALLIDFNSLTQDGGPHPQEGYQSYDAGHEVAADFDTKEYEAFGTEVTVTPSWPDSTDPRTMQMIDRGGVHDAFWVGDKVDLLTDWLGVDTRTGNGGNGDFTFEAGGETTRLDLTLGGLPTGKYNWVSYHHDTEWIHAEFFVELSVDSGLNFNIVENSEGEELQQMTASNDTGGNPVAEEHYMGDDEPDPILLPSTLIFDFEKPTDNDEVVLRFTPIAEIAVHKQLVGINGFELYLEEGVGPVTGDFDNNGLYECSDIDALYAGIRNSDVSVDLTNDGVVDAADVDAWLAEAGTAKGFSGPILGGDADLNGVVDATDLNVAGLGWQQEASSWCGGDFNQDSIVDAGDLNSMGVNWQTDIRSAAAATAAVPEPSSLVLLLFAAFFGCFHRRGK